MARAPWTLTLPDRLKAPLALLERGYHWWLDELAGLVPARLADLFAAPPPRTVVTLTPEGLGLFRIRRFTLKPLVKAKSEHLGLHMPDWPRAVRAKLRHVARVGIRLAPELTLHKVLRFPLAAEDQLAAALALQIDRHVPLKADLVYVDHRIIARDPDAGLLTAQIVMAKRERLDPLIAVLTGAGFKVEGAGLDEAHEPRRPPVDFLRGAALDRKKHARRLLASLAGALCLTALIGQGLIAVKEEAEEATLDEKIKALEPQIAKAHDLARALSGLEDEQRLAARGKRDFDPEGILAELSLRIGDGSWLTQLDLIRASADLQLTGFSNNATALVKSLEASALLSDARLRGPVTKDAEGRERFALSAKLESRRP